MKKRMALVAICASLIVLCSCGGSDTPSTDTLTLNFSEATASISKGLTKAVDPSSWTVQCVSRDSSDNKTILTGTYSSGAFTIAGVPRSQDTVCYLLDDAGSMKATVSVSDTNAVGNTRDAFTMSSASTAALAYDASAGTAVATPATGSALSSPATFDEEDLTYSYTINCDNYPKAYNVITDEESDYSCPSELNDVTILLHRISSSDSSGVTHYNYGVWAGENVYKACGYTEGLDTTQLPTGWTITSDADRSTAAITYTAPFLGFTSATTSDDIIDMIQGMTTAQGVSKSYSTYATEHAGTDECSDGSMCAKNYYFEIVRLEAQSGELPVCWPELKPSFDGSIVTFSAMSGSGGKTRPIGKHGFMESYINGSDMYMRDVETHPAYAPGDSGPIECAVSSTMLVSIVAPGGDPGNQKIGKFNQTQTATAISGVAADTEKCVANLGGDSEWTPKGFYSKADMVKVNPIPTP